MLNVEQEAAVKADSRRALVLAGAGSGKTRVLIERIAYLIEEKKVSPYEIMAFTFTRQAANEMRERLEKRIGNKAHGVYLSTMHGIGMQLLRRFGEFVNVRPSFTVYSDFEVEQLLRSVCEEHGALKNGKWKPSKKAILEPFNEYDQTGKPSDNDIFKAFYQRCRENNSVTYSGLIHGFLGLLEKGIIQKFMNIEHVLVDEAQDIDALQWSIITLLTKEKSLFCVADPSQSIYSFRGAMPEYLVKHSGTFDVYRLESNYRCMPDIVRAANNLIEHNAMRLPLEMRAMREDVCGLKYVTGVDSKGVADGTKALTLLGFNFDEIAILARNHILLQGIERELKALGVPCTRVGAKSEITRTEEFRRLIAPLKLICNPHDNFSFMLCHKCILPKNVEYSQMRLQAARENKSHFQVLENSGLIPFHTKDTRLAEAWIYWTGYYSHCNDEETEQAMRFVENYIETHPKASVSDFLDWLALYEVQSEKELQGGNTGVQLMTIHASKGIEFPCVVIAGMNEGILPSSQAMKDANGIEEERRLAYVAMTRAKDNLYVTSRPVVTEKEDENGKVRRYENPVSRFIAEAGL